MALITHDDFTELLTRIRQRGLTHMLARLRLTHAGRTRSTFNQAELQTSNWWNIPAVRKRWNKMITGSETLEFEDYVVEKYLAGSKNLTLLSPGCGSGGHERRFARHPQVFDHITGIDLSPNLIREATALTKKEGLENVSFLVADIHSMDIPPACMDVILFNQALHHFRNVRNLLENQIRPALKPGGLLIVHEYVGPARLQWEADELAIINRLLREEIPDKFRMRAGSRTVKQRVTGPGLLRMLLSDPSEAVDSPHILPALEELFEKKEGRPVGGNILMPLLKDIAHHFAGPNAHAQAILQHLFREEDEFLKTHPSLIHFGVYQKLD